MNKHLNEPLRVGAKFLASMALPTFCPRCFWYRLHCGDGPFSIFPSIFNEIDRFTKNVVHAYIDKHGHAPKWMGEFSEATGYIDPGFLTWFDEKNQIMLKGAPDVVLHDEDASRWFVGDYKTARHSAGQDRLLPQYRVQLLGYAFLLANSGYKRPQHAALFYFGPPEKPTSDELLARTDKAGFSLPLSVEVVGVDLGDFKQIHDFLHRAREIYDEKNAPEGCDKCKDCMRIDRYLRQRQHDSRPADRLVRMDLFYDYQGKKRPVGIYAEKGDDSTILGEDTGEWFPQWAE